MNKWEKLNKLQKEEKEKQKLKTLTGTVKELEVELLTFREKEKILEKLSKVEVKPIIAKKSKASESVAVAVASDWHSDELVDKDLVNGINEFNPNIFSSRSRKFFTSIVSLTNVQRGGTDIDTLVLALLGDFISGHIHDDLIESTSTSPTLAIISAKREILSGIDFVRKHFKRVIIPTAYGNHGRTLKKPRCSTAYLHSYEYTMYLDLQATVAALGWTNVEFQISKGYHNYLSVYESVLRLHHGDWIKYGGGSGGITIPVNKAIGQWDQLKQADLDVFGHFHQFITSGKFICNGSLVGYNAFALQIKASPEPPQQAYFLWEKNRGRTITTPIVF